MAAWEELTAERDIRRQLARYCRGMDRMDDDLALSVWHPDGTCDFTPDMFTGSARDYVDWVHRLHLTFDYTVHRIANTEIAVSGTAAVSEAYGHVLLAGHREDGSGFLRHGFGRYLDRWSLRGGRWAIDHREYRRDFGYIEDVEVSRGTGTRGSDDAVYALFSSLPGHFDK